MQETQVQALVQEDPTRCGAPKSVHHSYWASVLETGAAATTEPARALETVLSNERSHHNKGPMRCNYAERRAELPPKAAKDSESWEQCWTRELHQDTISHSSDGSK